MNKGKILIIIGIILIASAFGIFLHNEREDAQAGQFSRRALEIVREAIDQNEPVDMSPLQDKGQITEVEGNDGTSGQENTDASSGIANYEAKQESLGELFPDREMPAVQALQRDYCGVLEIPSLGLSLPILSSWSYPNLKISPCRYYGSVYQNNMVIAGHSYRNHFRPLYTIAIGAEVRFYDVENHRYRFRVVNRETLYPTQGCELASDSDEWDLTLFTCTPGGKTRCVVRCLMME